MGTHRVEWVGHPTVLTHDEEKEIAATCQAMQDVGLA